MAPQGRALGLVLALMLPCLDGLHTMPAAPSPACRAAMPGLARVGPHRLRATQTQGRAAAGHIECSQGAADRPGLGLARLPLSLVAAAGIACQPASAAAAAAAAAGGSGAQQPGAAVERALVPGAPAHDLQPGPRWQLAFTEDDMDELHDGELDGQGAKLAFADDEQELAAMSGEAEDERQVGMIESKEPEITVRGVPRCLPGFRSRALGRRLSLRECVHRSIGRRNPSADCASLCSCPSRKSASLPASWALPWACRAFCAGYAPAPAASRVVPLSVPRCQRGISAVRVRSLQVLARLLPWRPAW